MMDSKNFVMILTDGEEMDTFKVDDLRDEVLQAVYGTLGFTEMVVYDAYDGSVVFAMTRDDEGHEFVEVDEYGIIESNY